MPEAVSPYLDDLVTAFRRSLRRQQKAERTIVLYTMSVTMFRDWLITQGRPATLDQLTKTAVRAWLDTLIERNDASTVKTRLAGLRRFSRWLRDEGETETVATEGVEIPEVRARPVRVLDDDELRRLLDACKVARGRAGVYERSIFDGRRDEVIVRVLLDCGLRASELAGLTLDDVDLEQEVVFVSGRATGRGRCRSRRRLVRPRTVTCEPAGYTRTPGPTGSCSRSVAACPATASAGASRYSARRPVSTTCTRTLSDTRSRTAISPRVARNAT
ncbi:MAG TPA: site-specific integrase [Jiangellaceae bacterium]|nr:site-specific integrase [Jiangellaceae bacterium]